MDFLPEIRIKSIERTLLPLIQQVGDVREEPKMHHVCDDNRQ